MLLAEVCHVKGVTDGPPPEYDWEIYLKETARKIIEQQTPSQVLLVRSRLYELLVRLIPPNIIFQVRSFLGIFRVNRFSATILRTEQGLRRFWNESTFSKGKNFADFFRIWNSSIFQVAAEFEHRCNLGSKPIYHLEAFFTRFMADFKSFNDQFTDDFDDDDF